MTMTPRENDLREAAHRLSRNCENEPSRLYREFREWRSVGGAVRVTVTPHESDRREGRTRRGEIAKAKPINCIERTGNSDRRTSSGQSDGRAHSHDVASSPLSRRESFILLDEPGQPVYSKNVKQVATAGISGAEQQYKDANNLVSDNWPPAGTCLPTDNGLRSCAQPGYGDGDARTPLPRHRAPVCGDLLHRVPRQGQAERRPGPECLPDRRRGGEGSGAMGSRPGATQENRCRRRRRNAIRTTKLARQSSTGSRRSASTKRSGTPAIPAGCPRGD